MAATADKLKILLPNLPNPSSKMAPLKACFCKSLEITGWILTKLGEYTKEEIGTIYNIPKETNVKDIDKEENKQPFIPREDGIDDNEKRYDGKPYQDQCTTECETEGPNGQKRPPTHTDVWTDDRGQITQTAQFELQDETYQQTKQTRRQEKTGSKTLSRIPKGFPNLGNTCYMDSILQTLVWTPLLEFQLTRHKKKCGATKALLQLVQKVHCGGSGTVDRYYLGEVLNAARSHNSQFFGYHQQDSFEMYNALINGIQEEQLSIFDENRYDTSELTEMEKKMRKCPLTRLLGGMYMTVFYYESCEHVEIQFQMFTSICVPVPQEKRKVGKGDSATCGKHYETSKASKQKKKRNKNKPDSQDVSNSKIFGESSKNQTCTKLLDIGQHRNSLENPENKHRKNAPDTTVSKDDSEIRNRNSPLDTTVSKDNNSNNSTQSNVISGIQGNNKESAIISKETHQTQQVDKTDSGEIQKKETVKQQNECKPVESKTPRDKEKEHKKEMLKQKEIKKKTGRRNRHKKGTQNTKGTTDTSNIKGCVLQVNLAENPELAHSRVHSEIDENIDFKNVPKDAELHSDEKIPVTAGTIEDLHNCNEKCNETSEVNVIQVGSMPDGKSQNVSDMKRNNKMVLQGSEMINTSQEETADLTGYYAHDKSGNGNSKIDITDIGQDMSSENIVIAGNVSNIKENVVSLTDDLQGVTSVDENQFDGVKNSTINGQDIQEVFLRNINDVNQLSYHIENTDSVIGTKAENEEEKIEMEEKVDKGVNLQYVDEKSEERKTDCQHDPKRESTGAPQASGRRSRCELTEIDVSVIEKIICDINEMDLPDRGMITTSKEETVDSIDNRDYLHDEPLNENSKMENPDVVDDMSSEYTDAAVNVPNTIENSKHENNTEVYADSLKVGQLPGEDTLDDTLEEMPRIRNDLNNFSIHEECKDIEKDVAIKNETIIEQNTDFTKEGEYSRDTRSENEKQSTEVTDKVDTMLNLLVIHDIVERNINATPSDEDKTKRNMGEVDVSPVLTLNKSEQSSNAAGNDPLDTLERNQITDISENISRPVSVEPNLSNATTKAPTEIEVEHSKYSGMVSFEKREDKMNDFQHVYKLESTGELKPPEIFPKCGLAEREALPNNADFSVEKSITNTSLNLNSYTSDIKGNDNVPNNDLFKKPAMEFEDNRKVSDRCAQEGATVLKEKEFSENQTGKQLCHASFLPLQDIGQSRMTGIERGLMELIQTEGFNENELPCRECEKKDKSKASRCQTLKKLFVITPPPVLVLQINRFKQERSGLIKIYDKVTYPATLNFAPFCTRAYEVTNPEFRDIKYSLYGVVAHSGSLGGGHYVAYVKTSDRDPEKLWDQFVSVDWKDPERMESKIYEFFKTAEKAKPFGTDKTSGESYEQWYHISDSYVSPTNENIAIDNSNAYVLFYERI